MRTPPGPRRISATSCWRAVDLRPRRGEVVALRRGDIIFVPRSNLGEVANFVTLVRNALPIGFSYAIGGQYQSF